MLAVPFVALAEPSGGVVIGGSATITTSGTDTVIHQSTDRGIIKWDSFDVNANQNVRFQQPSSGSITVNRIMDSKASQIDGGISANGNVVLINPNGVMFGAGSRVDVGGLIATTSDLQDDNAFMAGGQMNFTKPGNADASIVNNGKITVGEAGLVGLVAPHVENNGTIHAKMGKVALASGDVHYVDLAGDGLISVAVSDDVLKQSVKNAGQIEAEGGSVLITAAQARGLVESVVTQSGTVKAKDITVSGQGSAVKVSGTLDAMGQTGGKAAVLGKTVELASTAMIDASGQTGGGKVNIGGAYQSGAELPASKNVTVAQGAVVKANAVGSGKGGDVVVWSDGNTAFHGHAEAKGGQSSGDGGSMEISGKDTLDFDGTVDLRAANGKTGDLLLDPTDITISSAASQNVTGSTPYRPNADNVTSVLNTTTLQNNLVSASITVQTRTTGSQPGNITVADPITWASTNTLTLNAANDIIVNAAISGRNLTLEPGHDLFVNAALNGTGTLNIRPYQGQSMGIGTGQTGTLSLDDAELNNLTGWTTVVMGLSNSTGAMNVGARTWSSNLTLTSGASAPIHINGAQSIGAHDMKITTDSDPDIAANLSGTGTFTVTTIQPGTSMGVAGEAGTVNLTVAELDRIVNNGWASISLGNTSSTAANRIGAYAGWKQRVLFSGGSGGVNFTGIQNFNNNSADIIGQNNITIGADLLNLYDLQIVQSNAAKTLGIGSGVGDFQIDQTELGHFKISHLLSTAYSTSSYAALNIADAAFGNYTVTARNIGNVNLGGTITSGFTGAATTASLAFIDTTTGSNGGNMTIAAGTTINPGTGRYIVYSRSPLLDNYNGFVRTQKSYNRSLNTYPTYSVTEQGNIFLYGIAPSVSLTAVNASREYGDTNPAFTYTATGLIDGDTISDALSSFGLSTPASATSDVGAYAINAAPIASGLRYGITSASGATLNVTKATVTAQADDQSRTYGDANPPLTVSYTGFKNGETSSVLDTAPVASTVATAASNVGTTAITVAGGLDNNYNFTFVPGTLTINPAIVTVTADPIVSLLGQIPVFTASFIGLKLGQTPDMLGTPPLFITNAPPDFNQRGTYTVTPYGVANPNYTFVFLDGALKIKGRRNNAASGTPGSTCLSRTMACPSDLRDQPDGAMTPLGAVLAAITQSYNEPKQDPNGINTLTSPIRVSPDVASFYGFNPKPL
jgi:filamentous hemagglutinin family protein